MLTIYALLMQLTVQVYTPCYILTVSFVARHFSVSDLHYKCLVSVAVQEDFQPMTYGFKMGSNITDMRAVGMMKEAEDDVSRTLRVNYMAIS